MHLCVAQWKLKGIPLCGAKQAPVTIVTRSRESLKLRATFCTTMMHTESEFHIDTVNLTEQLRGLLPTPIEQTSEQLTQVRLQPFNTKA